MSSVFLLLDAFLSYLLQCRSNLFISRGCRACHWQNGNINPGFMSNTIAGLGRRGVLSQVDEAAVTFSRLVRGTTPPPPSTHNTRSRSRLGPAPPANPQAAERRRETGAETVSREHRHAAGLRQLLSDRANGLTESQILNDRSPGAPHPGTTSAAAQEERRRVLDAPIPTSNESPVEHEVAARQALILEVCHDLLRGICMFILLGDRRKEFRLVIL